MSCDLYKQHHWQFACKLQDELVQSSSATTIVGEETISKQVPLAVKSASYNFLFYCPCGKLKVISGGNGETITNINTETLGYEGKING